MEYEETQILGQIINAMDESVKKMEQAYSRRDIESFENAKKVVLGFQQEITKVLAGTQRKRVNDA